MSTRLRPARLRPARLAPSSRAALAVLLAAMAGATTLRAQEQPVPDQEAAVIHLPDPVHDSDFAVERAVSERRSVREYSPEPLSLQQVGQLLWAAQGVTERMPAPEGWPWGEWGGGLRAAPSAGALYPLETYVLATAVDALDPGLYRYLPAEHGLVRVGNATREQLASAALGQRAVAEAAVVVLLTGVRSRTAAKYGDRATRYVHMEVGAAAENLYLQATALGLGTVFIGAFRDDAVRSALGLPAGHAPLAILPVGIPAGT